MKHERPHIELVGEFKLVVEFLVAHGVKVENDTVQVENESIR